MADETPPRQEHYPPFVQSDEEKRRWDAAVAAAEAMWPGEAEQAWSAARVLYRSDFPT